jgi:hypothetical protein
MQFAARLLRVILLVLLVTAIAPVVSLAQTSNGTIAGAIVDPRDAVVPNAHVKAISAQFGAVHESQTDSAGTYRLESLQPGTYTVTISATGFANLQVSNVLVNASVTTTVNGKLTIAAQQQTIEIEAPASQVIDTQSGQLGGTLSYQEVTELPQFSLNPAELAFTLPGVHDTPQGVGAVNTSFTQGVEFSVNGTRPRSNNFLIDGQDDNDYGIAGQAFQPTNIGAIQEVTILTNAYSAEFGRGGGSVTNYIYKSGTNNFHGDLWEINRNSALAAIPAEAVVADPTAKNPFDNENTFGFDIGGPIKKDKLFFFATSQWDRERQLSTGPDFKLPTAAGIATLKTSFPNNANINLFLNAIGSLVAPVSAVNPPKVNPIATGLNGACPCVDFGDFQVQNVETAANAIDWNIRMDWQASEHDTLTASYIRDRSSLSPDNFANAKALPGFQTEQGGPSQFFRTQWLHTVSAKVVNELRFSFSSFDAGFNLTPATLANPLANIPWIQFGNDINFPSIGVDSNFPQGSKHKHWQMQDAVTYSTGRHTIKGGIDVTFLDLRDTNALNTRGTITYNFGGGFTSLGNFIQDFTGKDPGSLSKGFGNPNFATSVTMYSPYVQDTWRVRDNLTFNLGLRYEYWGALANTLQYPALDVSLGFGVPNATFPGSFSAPQIPDKRNFAPRVSFAYTPHWGHLFFGENKTVLRAGYGIFYDGLFSNIVGNTAESQPNTLGGGIPSQIGRGQKLASTFPTIDVNPNPLLGLFTMASNLHNPMTQQWNVDLQRDLPLGLVMTVAYVGTRGTHLFANQDFNPQVLYSFTNPNFAEISVRSNAGDSKYDSAQLEVEKKLRSGSILRASYTYSKFFDDTSEVFTTTGASSYAQVLTNQRSDWGPSAFDQRHRFTLAYVWKIPYFKHNTLLGALTNQWEWSGIATIESGGPNTVSVGFDNIGNGHPNSRPDLANAAAPLDSFGIDGGDIGFPAGTYDFTCLFLSTVACDQGPFPNSKFHFIIPNTVPGNVGRNSQFGPGQIYFDTSIQRDFPIHFWKLENQTLKFRLELFNAFNHPNLFTPSYTMTDSNFNNTAITINGGRQIKLWLKYTF